MYRECRDEYINVYTMFIGCSHQSLVDVSIVRSTEYVELDQQLDALDAALSAVERKRDQLHEETLQFLLEAKAARVQISNENKSKETENDCDTNSSKEQS